MPSKPSPAPTEPTPVSLDQWSETHPSKTGPCCWVCNLPADVREQVDRHLAARATVRRVICEWLISVGHKGATVGKLDNHVNGKHHLGENVG